MRGAGGKQLPHRVLCEQGCKPLCVLGIISVGVLRNDLLDRELVFEAHYVAFPSLTQRCLDLLLCHSDGCLSTDQLRARS
jgi:hypothetical protein